MWTALLYALVLLLVPIGCGSDADIQPHGDDGTVRAAASAVNEGNFTRANSSLSFYDEETGSVTRSVFKTANGRPLGFRRERHPRPRRPS